MARVDGSNNPVCKSMITDIFKCGGAFVVAAVALSVLIPGTLGLTGHIRTLSRATSIGMVGAGSVITILAVTLLCKNECCRGICESSTRSARGRRY